MHNGGREMDALYGGIDKESHDIYGLAVSYNLGNFTAAPDAQTSLAKEPLKSGTMLPIITNIPNAQQITRSKYICRCHTHSTSAEK